MVDGVRGRGVAGREGKGLAVLKVSGRRLFMVNILKYVQMGSRKNIPIENA